MIVELARGPLKTKYGDFTEVLFYDGQKESLALIMGQIEGSEDLLCRVHSACVFGHYFNSVECDCQAQMDRSQQKIQQAGKGIIILLDQEGKGNGHLALLHSVAFKRQGANQADAYTKAGFKKDARDFSSAGKIVNHLKIKSTILLTDNPDKATTLRNFGVEVSGIASI